MVYHVALIPSDGIGKEVVPEGVRVLETLAENYGFDVQFEEFPYSCSYYRTPGRPIITILSTFLMKDILKMY